MAQKDAIIRNLEHQLEEREREIEVLKDSIAGSEEADAAKILDMEKRMVEIEVLVKGLTEELLDLKSIVMKIHKNLGERRAPRPQVEFSRKPEIPVHKEAENVKPAAERKKDTVMIMQPDGTLKPEERHKEGVIIASNRDTLVMAKPPVRNESEEESIIIGKNVYEKEPRKSKPLIYAEEKKNTKKE
jgi:hypothetical protein